MIPLIDVDTHSKNIIDGIFHVIKDTKITVTIITECSVNFVTYMYGYIVH